MTGDQSAPALKPNDLQTFESELHAMRRQVADAMAEVHARDELLIRQGREAAIGGIIGAVAHEWRQPLNALSLLLTNLADSVRCGELDGPSVERAVTAGQRLIDRMSTTINVFSTFLCPEKKRHAFSALHVIRETVSLLDAVHRRANVAVTIVGDDVTLFGYANEYAQVLMNLLSNAREAIEGAGVRAGRIEVHLSTRRDFGCVTVKDNGGGISPDVLKRIFEPYFSTKPTGSGIGLALCRQIAEERLGGLLQVQNVENGAEFVLLTPIYAGPPPP